MESEDYGHLDGHLSWRSVSPVYQFAFHQRDHFDNHRRAYCSASAANLSRTSARVASFGSGQGGPKPTLPHGGMFRRDHLDHH